MASKLDKIKAKYEAAQTAKADLREDIANLEAAKAQEEREAQQAAEEGDVSGYMEKKALADRHGAELFVKTTQLKKADAVVTPEEAQAAWNDTAQALEKKLRALWDEYMTSRHELAATFKRFFYLLEQGYFSREQCAIYTGADPTDPYFRDAIEQYPLDISFMGNITHDKTFFVRTGETSQDEDGHIGILLNQRRTFI